MWKIKMKCNIAMLIAFLLFVIIIPVVFINRIKDVPFFIVRDIREEWDDLLQILVKIQTEKKKRSL